MASSNMVEKLGLHATVHPHLYELHWLNQGKGLHVNSWCLIPLSIGKSYQDEIWCDIIPMDACHILLGRPCDGDQPTLEPKEDEEVKGVQKVIREVKEIQTMVRSITSQAQELLPETFGSSPVFVNQLTQAPLGM